MVVRVKGPTFSGGVATGKSPMFLKITSSSYSHRQPYLNKAGHTGKKNDVKVRGGLVGKKKGSVG